MTKVRFISIALTVASLCVIQVNPGAFAEPIKIAQAATDTVCFNMQNHKFHALSCLWAKRCTVNCIEISRAEAHKRGGIPCKVCGGGEG